MTRIFRAFVVLVTLTCVGVGAAHALDSADVPEAVENAKTAADHEAIAAHWDEQAKAARDTAARHRQLAATYSKQPPSPPKGGESHTFHTQMAKHCDALVKQYEQAAQNFEALAAAHREQAKAVR